MPDRNLPPPWSSEEHSAYFVVRDNNGLAVAYVYYDNKPRYQSAAKALRPIAPHGGGGRVVLNNLSEHIRECLRHAEHCARQVKQKRLALT